ncbi:helix-turn-helix transcriptional regulator [Paenibacillus alkalitolerans]|uniref:helix-turn-helix transcriptional regulator n=1 Tax=Paenibacillus alkalitolerans TaxID=2799335 RepID=UPI0018F2BBF4|nr:helix-turn-helix transcriptional regulator [Paenibacillus alkalitolerans]
MDPRFGRCLLRKLRKEKRITQAELEKRTGISRVMISRYENNKDQMSLINSKLIADALGVYVEDLYTW